MTETTATEKTRNRQIDLAKGTFYRSDPDLLVLVGRDKTDVYTDHHPLARAGQGDRARRVVNVRRVLNMLKLGFTSVIECIRGAGPGTIPWEKGSQDDLLVVKGRGRTIDARVAKSIILKFREVHAEESTTEQIAAELTKFAGFEISETIVKSLINRGVDEFLVKFELTRGDAGSLIGRLNADNAAGLRDPEDDQYTQALAMQEYLDLGKDFGRTEQDVAEEFGVSLSTVTNRTKLLGAAPELVKAAKAGEVTWSDVLGSCGLPAEQQVERLAAIPKKAPGQQRRPGKRGEQRRPGGRTADKICEFLGPGHDVSAFWKFMRGAPGGVEALLKVDKGLKDIVQPEKKVKQPKPPKAAKGGTRKKKASKK